MSESDSAKDNVREQIRAEARSTGWEVVTEIEGLDKYEKADKKLLIYYQLGSQITLLSYVAGRESTSTEMDSGIDLGAAALRLLRQES